MTRYRQSRHGPCVTNRLRCHKLALHNRDGKVCTRERALTTSPAGCSGAHGGARRIFDAGHIGQRNYCADAWS
jgi:hypothetical protein